MDYVNDITNHQKDKHFSLGDHIDLKGILSDSSNKHSLRQLAKHFITVSAILSGMNSSAVLILILVDTEQLVLITHILLAIATVSINQKGF